MTPRPPHRWCGALVHELLRFLREDTNRVIPVNQLFQESLIPDSFLPVHMLHHRAHRLSEDVEALFPRHTVHGFVRSNNATVEICLSSLFLYVILLFISFV